MERDVERRFERLEALLESNFQKSEVRFQKAEARMDRAEARMDRAEARSEKLEARFEKRMKGFEKLAAFGMREIGKLERLHRESDEKMNALIDAQQRTEASLRQFIDSIRKSTNGH